MEIGPVARPGPTSTAPVSRIAQSGPTVAVGVQLSEAAVSQAPAAERPNPDPPRRQAAAPADSVERRIKIDPATQQVILESVDTMSGEVVRQVPEETMLRLQVYARALRRAAMPRTGREGSFQI